MHFFVLKDIRPEFAAILVIIPNSRFLSKGHLINSFTQVRWSILKISVFAVSCCKSLVYALFILSSWFSGIVGGRTLSWFNQRIFSWILKPYFNSFLKKVSSFRNGTWYHMCFRARPYDGTLKWILPTVISLIRLCCCKSRCFHGPIPVFPWSYKLLLMKLKPQTNS